MRLSVKRRVDYSLSSELPTGRRQTLQLGNQRMDVVRMGRGEPLVLVPGLAGGWKLVAPLARRLAQHHQVYLYGLRGDRDCLGGSAAYSLSDHAEDVGRLIDHLGLERPYLFGVSFGGAIALEYAAENSGRLGGLVLQGVEARFSSQLASQVARRVLERFPLPSDNRFVNQFFNLLHASKPEPGPLVDFVIERCWETDQSVIARRLGLLESFDMTDRLWQIDVPTLVLGGSRDVVVPASRQKALADAMSGARYESIDGAGHIAFLSHRIEIARKVARFVRSYRNASC